MSLNAKTILFLLIQLIRPICQLIGYAFGGEFYLYSETVYLILSACASAFTLCAKEKDQDVPPLLCLMTFPITAVSCAYDLLFLRSMVGVPTTVVRCICAYTFLMKVPDRWYKYLTQVVCTLLLVGYAGLCLFDLTFGSIGKMNIVEKVPSPNGKYTALLINDDQGALGGNTFIRITQPDILSLGFGGFRPRTSPLYQGPWGMFEHIELSWYDDTRLQINEDIWVIEK